MFWNARKVINAGSFNTADATGVNVEFGEKAWVKRIIFSHSVAMTTAVSIITLIRRPMSGAAGTTLGAFTIPATAAANAVYYVDLPRPDGVAHTLVDGSIGYDALPDWYIFDVGQELNIASDGGGTAGVATFWVEYQAVGDQPLPGGWTRLNFTAA